MTSLIHFVLFVAPLCVFAFKLEGVPGKRAAADYTELSSRYVGAFKR